MAKKNPLPEKRTATKNSVVHPIAPSRAVALTPFASTASSAWLLKTEPDCYSIDDLARDRRTGWGGVRNYQARNYMRDQMRVGDSLLIYHSGGDPPAIVGLARVSRTGLPDLTAQDPRDDHYDPKATPEQPIWMMVEVEFVEKFAKELPLDAMRKTPELADMILLRRGNRLSVMPVTKGELSIVLRVCRAE